jgi:hypothetical protein
MPTMPDVSQYDTNFGGSLDYGSGVSDFTTGSTDFLGNF